MANNNYFDSFDCQVQCEELYSEEEYEMEQLQADFDKWQEEHPDLAAALDAEDYWDAFFKWDAQYNQPQQANQQ